MRYLDKVNERLRIDFKKFLEEESKPKTTYNPPYATQHSSTPSWLNPRWQPKNSGYELGEYSRGGTTVPYSPYSRPPMYRENNTSTYIYKGKSTTELSVLNGDNNFVKCGSTPLSRAEECSVFFVDSSDYTAATKYFCCYNSLLNSLTSQGLTLNVEDAQEIRLNHDKTFFIAKVPFTNKIAIRWDRRVLELYLSHKRKVGETKQHDEIKNNPIGPNPMTTIGTEIHPCLPPCYV